MPFTGLEKRDQPKNFPIRWRRIFFSSTSEPRVGEKDSACIESEASNSRQREKIVDGQDSGEELSDLNPLNDELEESETYLPVYKGSITGKLILDEGTQTMLTKYMLSAIGCLENADLVKKEKTN